MVYDFGRQLKELREKNNLTQEQVAKKLQTTKSSISSYENNINTPPVSVITKLAYLYGVTTDYLLGIDTKRRLLIDGLTEEQEHILATLVENFRKANQV